MLSNSSSNLHVRQRAHRRQNSTPTAFAAVKIPALPNVQQQQQRAMGHRRGLSLDTRRQSISPTTIKRQDFATVSMSTNTGLATTTSPQHVLREAQQQRIQARPGPYQKQAQQNQRQQIQQQNYQQQVFVPANDHENYLISPGATPQTQRFDSSCIDSSSIPYEQYGAPMAAMMQKNQAGFASNMAVTRDFELFGHDSALSTPTYMTFNESPATAQGWISEGDGVNSRRTSRRISNGIMDRVARFENMGMEAQRPATPPQQNANNYFPPTPMETPHDRMVKHETVARSNRYSDGWDESMEETIKPGRNKPNQRSSTIFDEMRRQAEEAESVQSRSNRSSGIFEAPVQTPDFMNMNNFNSEFMKIQGDYDGITDSLDVTPDMSQHPTPQTPYMNYQPGPFETKPDLRPPEMMSMPDSPTRSRGGASRRGSPHRRTESLASIASAASIASINIEDTKTDTGVTTEDIAIYIQGPDPADGKWVCLYEDCGKKFGRKENIKSHVQTHLNDRQYQCPNCHKCFVRQHDLKRHAKIHTGIKPYPCECGNSFARHDALTRHRQRGMCIGAFDGIVKKVVKRGRPRKHRPDMDDRLNKSARTRNKNKDTSSASSQSGYSDSSAPNSPENDFNMLEDPRFQMMNVAIGADPVDVPLQIACMSSAPMPTMPDPIVPQEMEYAASPSAASHHSQHSPYISPEAIMEPPSCLAEQPPSPTKSVVSQYNTPPELSQSSSPPATRFFDNEPNTTEFTEDSLLAGMRGSSGGIANTSLGSIGLGDHEEEMLMKAFTNDDSLVQFDRDPSLLMMGKFDEEFDNAMFTNSDDVFFGTN